MLCDDREKRVDERPGSLVVRQMVREQTGRLRPDRRCRARRAAQMPDQSGRAPRSRRRRRACVQFMISTWVLTWERPGARRAARTVGRQADIAGHRQGARAATERCGYTAAPGPAAIRRRTARRAPAAPRASSPSINAIGRCGAELGLRPRRRAAWLVWVQPCCTTADRPLARKPFGEGDSARAGNDRQHRAARLVVRPSASSRSRAGVGADRVVVAPPERRRAGRRRAKQVELARQIAAHVPQTVALRWASQDDRSARAVSQRRRRRRAAGDRGAAVAAARSTAAARRLRRQPAFVKDHRPAAPRQKLGAQRLLGLAAAGERDEHRPGAGASADRPRYYSRPARPRHGNAPAARENRPRAGSISNPARAPRLQALLARRRQTSPPSRIRQAMALRR